MARNGDWIQTYSGKQFWPLDSRPEDICLLDISWALSQKCRYTGHCNRFYSVLEHSLLVSRFCQHYPLEGLFHDAAEAYLPDVPRPIKPLLKGFVEIEDRVLQVIFEKYGLVWPIPEEVKRIDYAMLIDEQRILMPNSPADWGLKGGGIGLAYLPVWSPEITRELFFDFCREKGIK